MRHTLFSDWSSNWHILDMSDIHSSFSTSDCISGHYTRAGCALQKVKMKKVFWRKGDQWPASLRECPFFSEPTQRCVGGGKMRIQEKIFPSFWAMYKAHGPWIVSFTDPLAFESGSVLRRPWERPIQLWSRFSRRKCIVTPRLGTPLECDTQK